MFSGHASSYSWNIEYCLISNPFFLGITDGVFATAFDASKIQRVDGTLLWLRCSALYIFFRMYSTSFEAARKHPTSVRRPTWYHKRSGD